MKHTLYLITLFAGFLLTISSCKKDADQLPPETIDSLQSVLPKQIIWNDLDLFDNAVVFSVKYDTVNHRTELYYDDTTNANPYDKLAASYVFNDAGYLIKSTGFDGEDFIDINININRTSDNRVNFIEYDDRENNEKDTVFYTYQSVRGGTNITTINHQWLNSTDTITYEYSGDNRLINVPRFSHDRHVFGFLQDGNIAYTYNANNSIDKIRFTFSTANTLYSELKFTYSSGIPDDKEDLLNKVLLGKDYYLPHFSKLNPFNFYLDGEIDPGFISPTNPYHVSNIGFTYTNSSTGNQIEQAMMAYEFNDKKLLSKVTFNVVGEPEASMSFKY